MSDLRLEQFKTEIAEMRLKDPVAGRDTMLLRLGAALLVIGVAACVVAYFLSHSTSDPLAQRDDLTIGLAGVAVTVAGAALFVRYSLAAFLRFWLARLIYELRVQGDRQAGMTAGASETGTNTRS